MSTIPQAEDREVKPPPPDGLTYDVNSVKIHLESDGDRYYQLNDTELAFFSSQTRIPDPEELKEHILKVQHEAYEASDPNYITLCNDTDTTS